MLSIKRNGVNKVHTLLEIMEAHNAVVDALGKCQIKIPADFALQGMVIWHKLACEGAAICCEMRRAGMNATCDMQSGRITYKD